MIKLSQNTRLSYPLIQGSFNKRADLVDKTNRKIFCNLFELYRNDRRCDLRKIKSHYNATLPEDKDICFYPMKKKDYDDLGGCFCIDEDSDIINGYYIEMPVAKGKYLNILDLSSLMHESTHVLDYLMNPKYVANYRRMQEKNIFDKKYYKIYDELYDNTDAIIKYKKKELLEKIKVETEKRLKNVPSDEKIIFLTWLKYNLQMEYHAYSQDIKFARILKRLGKPVDEESLDDYNLIMLYPEKYAIVSNMLEEEIKKQRLIHASKFPVNKKSANINYNI